MCLRAEQLAGERRDRHQRSRGKRHLCVEVHKGRYEL